MTKLLKKSLAVVLSVALCLSVMVCGFVASADGEPTITLVADNATPAAGDTVKIDVKVANFDAVAGAQFTVDLGGLEYVSVASDAIEDIDAFTNVVDGDVRLVNEYMNDADAGYVDISAANGVLFTITATVPADAAAEDAFTVDFANAKFCEATDGEPEVAVKAESVTLTVPAEEVDLTDPDLRKKLSIALSISDKAGFGFTFTIDTAKYDDFEIEISRVSVGSGYVLDTTPIGVYTKANSTAMTATIYKLPAYKGIGMYELTTEFTVNIVGKKDGEIAGTCSDTFSLAELLVNTLNGTSGTAVVRKMYSELLWLGEAALAKIKAENPGTEICELPSPVANYTGEKETTYTNIEDTTTYSGLTTKLTLAIGSSPTIAYLVTGVNSDIIKNGKLIASHDSIKLGHQTTGELAITGGEGVKVIGTNVQYKYTIISLYDANKVISLNVYDGNGNVVANYETSLAMRLCATLNDPNAKLSAEARELYERVLIFGEAARAAREN